MVGPCGGRTWAARGAIAFLVGLIVQVGAIAAAQTPETSAPAAQPKSIQEVVKVTVHAPEAAIDDIRGGSIVVLVDNSGRRQISVVRVVARLAEEEVAAEGEGLGTDETDAAVTFEARRSPSCASPGDAIFPCVVAPGSQAAVPIGVTVHSLARTGKVLVTVEVVVERTPVGGIPKQATLVVVQSLALGIFGEAELAPLLQVPSILVLPGALFLVVLLVFWRVGARPVDAKRDEFVVSAAGVEFWICAVGVSLLLGLGWRVFYGRNLLKGYGYRDIGGVLVAAVILAGICAAVLWRFRQRKKDQLEKAADKLKAEALTKIEAGDSPRETLEKFTQWKESADLSFITVDHEGKIMILYSPNEPDVATVIGTNLQYAMVKGPDAADVELELSGLAIAGDLVPFAKRLIELESGGKVSVTWAGGPPIPGPKSPEPQGSRAVIERAAT